MTIRHSPWLALAVGLALAGPAEAATTHAKPVQRPASAAAMPHVTAPAARSATVGGPARHPAGLAGSLVRRKP